MREGVAGYGCYWMLLEMLRDCPGYRTFYFPESFAFSFHINDVSIVERVCKDYDLFQFDNEDFISSPWLLSVMEDYDDQKKKRAEAGRRGASRRWGSTSVDDGKAMALPSMDDGKAIAYNITPSNITSDNITLPDLTSSRKVGAEFLEVMCGKQPQGHAPGYVAQVGLQYGMTEAAVNFICERSENADITHPTYKAFCALVKRIQQEKWRPDHPDNFFLKKLFKKD